MIRSLSANDLIFILFAVRWTFALVVVSLIGGSIIGLIVALLRVGDSRVIRTLAVVYIRVIQGTPLLLQLFVVFFGSDMVGFGLDPFWASVVALGVNAGAFLGDIWRGSLQSVPRGQVEAAKALGLSYFWRMRDVVLPQAIRIATPPTVGFLVHHIKSTSLAALIGCVELTQAGHLVNSAVFRPFLIFGLVGAIYFVLCWPLSIASQRLEVRLARSTAR